MGNINLNIKEVNVQTATNEIGNELVKIIISGIREAVTMLESSNGSRIRTEKNKPKEEELQ